MDPCDVQRLAVALASEGVKLTSALLTGGGARLECMRVDSTTRWDFDEDGAPVLGRTPKGLAKIVRATLDEVMSAPPCEAAA